MLPENWFLKDGSLKDHGLDGDVEDLDIGRLSKDFFLRCQSQKVERTNFRLTMPKTLFRKFPIIGSISSFLGVTPVRTSSCQVCSAGVLWGAGGGGG